MPSPNGGDQQREADGFDEQIATSDCCNVAEGVLNLTSREVVLGTQQLSAVHLSRGQKSCNDADQDGSQKNVAPRVFDFFRQSRNAVKPYISEDCNRRAVKHPVYRESLGIVERTEKIGLWILRQAEDVADGVPEEREDDRTHNREEDPIEAGGGLEPRRLNTVNKQRRRMATADPDKGSGNGFRSTDRPSPWPTRWWRSRD